MKTTGIQLPSNITGIYVTLANKVTGIPLFRQNGQEFRESERFVELWQENERNKMEIKKRWRKTSVSFIEYDDKPNIWIETGTSSN